MRQLSASQIIGFNKRLCEKDGVAHTVLTENLIKSAVGAAFFESPGIGYVHGSIPEIAAALCFKIIKNHAFRDGNKRTALIAAVVFLNANDYDISYESYDNSTELHLIIESVASGKVGEDELKSWFLERTFMLCQ